MRAAGVAGVTRPVFAYSGRLESMGASAELVSSPRAAERIGAARVWLRDLPAGTEALVIAHAREAAEDLARDLCAARTAVFGIHCLSLNELVGILAADWLAALGIAPAVGLANEAVAARALFRLRGSNALACYEPVAERPGLPAALARTLLELRLNRITPADLAALKTDGEALGALLAQYEHELENAGLGDRATLLGAATEAALATPSGRLIGAPVLMLDVAIESVLERDFISALAARAPHLLATVPAGDTQSLRMTAAALSLPLPDAQAETESHAAESSLFQLQDFLFSDRPVPKGPLDETVTLTSAPGEMHECVEIARRIRAEARRGVPFDRIAVLLHAPARYGPCLEEALGRAGVPAYFARGTARPEPGGRALLALLACAAERLSARRFAEYLSLGQVPNPPATPTTGKDTADGTSAEFVLPGPESRPGFLPATLDSAPGANAEGAEAGDSSAAARPIRAPWRWEKLIVEASVIGGEERWQRRLEGLREEFRLKRGDVADDDARAAMLERRISDLDDLSAAALPLIARLAALAREAPWGRWLSELRELCAAAIAEREHVLSALAELQPMAPVGPVGLDEVRAVLAERLGRLEAPPARRRYGAVFVAPTRYARGFIFDVVIVPGLAERLFPGKLAEDPLLLDAARRQLSPDLALQADRLGAERLALRLAVGAARERLVASYPRVDLDQGRPRVPSFYALELMRAAEGEIPGFEELARRAALKTAGRMGWPAPDDENLAIDDAEFDLAVLERLRSGDPAATVGAAHYLLGASEHLGRSLRARARRWLRRWTPADGLVDPDPGARRALARHRLDARSFSPTALQNFAACPYRFFLYAVWKLEPREEIEALEVIDPLTRGALFHEAQFELLTELKAAALLPLAPAHLDEVLKRADRALERVALRYREKLAPAIERVWRDGIDSLRADLSEWLRRAAQDPEHWRPERFELAFGLAGRGQADPGSSAEPVALDLGLKLRGSIDLVERGPDNRLRATDHKTGRPWAPRGVVIGGGRILQPVLYAMAAERLLAEPVAAGRLYYCTAAGGFEERIVPLDATARDGGRKLIETVGGALEDGFLPAAPGDGECARCDYRRVCGPYEERRVELKPKARVRPLMELRNLE